MTETLANESKGRELCQRLMICNNEFGNSEEDKWLMGLHLDELILMDGNQQHNYNEIHEMRSQLFTRFNQILIDFVMSNSLDIERFETGLTEFAIFVDSIKGKISVLRAGLNLNKSLRNLLSAE
jgi:hypothetical protein